MTQEQMQETLNQMQNCLTNGQNLEAVEIGCTAFLENYQPPVNPVVTIDETGLVTLQDIPDGSLAQVYVRSQWSATPEPIGSTLPVSNGMVFNWNLYVPGGTINDIYIVVNGVQSNIFTYYGARLPAVNPELVKVEADVVYFKLNLAPTPVYYNNQIYFNLIRVAINGGGGRFVETENLNQTFAVSYANLVTLGDVFTLSATIEDNRFGDFTTSPVGEVIAVQSAVPTQNVFQNCVITINEETPDAPVIVDVSLNCPPEYTQEVQITSMNGDVIPLENLTVSSLNQSFIVRARLVRNGNIFTGWTTAGLYVPAVTIFTQNGPMTNFVSNYATRYKLGEEYIEGGTFSTQLYPGHYQVRGIFGNNVTTGIVYGPINNFDVLVVD